MRIATLLSVLIFSLSQAHAASSPVKSTPVHGAVAVLKKKIRTIDAQIGRTEKQIKINLADSLDTIEQIGVRESEIEQSQRTKRVIGILGIFVGMPLVGLVSAVQMKDDDARLKTLRTDKKRLDRQHAKLSSRLEVHTESRTQLMTQVKLLSTQAKTLTAELAVTSTEKATTIDGAAARVLSSERLVANLGRQVELLTQVHTSASQLGVDTHAHLVDAQAALVQAQTMVNDSRRDLVDLVVIAVSRSPQAAARKWLSKKLTSEVTKMLVDAGLKGPVGKEVAKELAKRLVNGTPQENDAFSDSIGEELDAA